MARPDLRPAQGLRILAALGAIAVAACRGGGPSEAAEELHVARDTVGAIEIVTIRGALPRLPLEPPTNLGQDDPALDGADPEDFAWVSSVSVTPAGELLVADLGRFQIEVFDAASGVHLRTLGTRGDGPGEFESIFSVAPFADDILAMDIDNGRTSRLDRSGGWIERWRAAGRLVASPVDFRLYPVGPNEVYQWAYALEDGFEVPVWRRYTDAGEDEIPRIFPEIERPFPDRVVCPVGRGMSWFPHPEAPVSLAHPLPGRRSVVATTDRPGFAILDDRGDTIRVVRRDVEDIRMTDERWQPTQASYDAWLEDKNVSVCEPRELPRPDVAPPLRSLLVDVAGRIWIERTLADGTLWEAFDVDGAPIGSADGFDHDRERTVPFFGRDYVAWVTRGAFDIPGVHVSAWGG